MHRIKDHEAATEVSRAVASAVALSVLFILLAQAPNLVARATEGRPIAETAHDLAVVTMAAGVVLVGVVSGIASARLASSSLRRRRTAAAALWAATTLSVGTTLVVAGRLTSDEAMADAVVVASFAVVGTVVLLGTLLGYAAGRERRIARDVRSDRGSR